MPALLRSFLGRGFNVVTVPIEFTAVLMELLTTFTMLSFGRRMTQENRLLSSLSSPLVVDDRSSHGISLHFWTTRNLDDLGLCNKPPDGGSRFSDS